MIFEWDLEEGIGTIHCPNDMCTGDTLAFLSLSVDIFDCGDFCYLNMNK